MPLPRAPACRGHSWFKTTAICAALLSYLGLLLPPPVAHSANSELTARPEGSAQPFTLPSAGGPSFSLGALRGRIVLVHFFATWCEPCREELPALRRLVARADPDSLMVVAISVAEVELRVRRFLETTPVNFPVLLDQDRAVAKAWNISALPSTVVLDADLKPRLATEADFAWDSIDPGALVEMLKRGTMFQLKPIHKGG